MSAPIRFTLTHVGPLLREAFYFPMRKHSRRTAIISGALVCVVMLVAAVVLNLVFPTSAKMVAPLSAAFAFLGYIVFANLIATPLMKEAIEQARAINEDHSPTEAEFRPTGFALKNSVSTVEFAWVAVSEIFALKTGTGLQYGGLVSAVPDTDLPEGMTGKAFRAKIAEWRRA